MAQHTKTTETFIKKEKAYTECDAIHPRFMEPQDPEKIHEYQVENQYYCEACDEFFGPTVNGLKTHFKDDMVQHKPYGSCLYCRGPVYHYTLNNVIRLFHNCIRRTEFS